MILLDTSALSYLLYPDSSAPIDPATGKVVEHWDAVNPVSATPANNNTQF